MKYIYFGDSGLKSNNARAGTFMSGDLDGDFVVVLLGGDNWFVLE